MKTAAILLMTGLILSGCASTGKIDPTAIAMAYYRQDRTYDPVKVEGVSEITMKAPEGQTISVVLTSQLQPLSIYPRDPSTLKQLLEGLADLGVVIGASMVGLELVEGVSRGPTVVKQPDPIIVNSHSH